MLPIETTSHQHTYNLYIKLLHVFSTQTKKSALKGRFQEI